ncbi:hypothetical protein B2J88_47115 [Rhodococcus sp. SRB_17]|nr:hypothetical protein [Rhodococcus sp. SRB_17]
MQIRRGIAGLAVIGVALVVVGCGSGGNDVVAGTSITVTAETEPLPDRVAVHQPAFLDTSVPAASLPVWPGPHPSEFLKPSPPSGLSGEIAGEQAGVVYVAALDNPDAIWNVEGIVVWLVVEPLL